MATTKLSSKGQVIIPRDAHERHAGLDIYEHDEGVSFAAQLPYARTSLDDVAGCLEWSGPTITIEEMDKAVAEEARRRAKS